MIYADSSFLVALFVEGDHHRPKAWKWWTTAGGPVLTASKLTLFETENTMRGLAQSKMCRPSEIRHALLGLSRGLLEGLILKRSVPEHRLFPQAHRLSQRHTTNATFGALDILHVAIAVELKAVNFLSFDLRQRSLAAAEGLVVEPTMK